jgi:alpha-tubulin suppressor-like RCC1 family protein
MKSIVRLFTIALVLGFLIGCGGGSSSGGNKTSTGGKGNGTNGTNYNSTFIAAAGGVHSLAVDNDGKLWASGSSLYGQLGFGNYMTSQNSFRPVTFSGLAPTKIVSAAGGYGYSLAVDSDGGLWASGINSYGQLGFGNNSDQNSFQRVTFNASSPAKIISVSAGTDHSLALDSEGRVWASGDNLDGQLGLGNTVNQNSFQRVTISNLTSGAKIVSIAAGQWHSLALDSNGTLWATGINNGVSGLGIVKTNEFHPVPSLGLTTKIVSIATSWEHSLALDNEGKLWATGDNQLGQLGLGNTADQNSFQRVTISNLTSGAEIVSIAAGSYYSLALDSNGRVWAAGGNDFGQLGLGKDINKTNEFQPVTISGLPSGVKIVSIAAGLHHSFALDSNGKIWATGNNYYGGILLGGQLGLGDWDNRNEFTQIPLFDLHERLCLEVGCKFGIGGRLTMPPPSPSL